MLKRVLFLLFFICQAMASFTTTSAVQTLTIVVVGGNDSVSFSGDVSRTLYVPQGGFIVDDSTTYGYTTGSFGSPRQITAYVQNALPEGLELSVALDPPAQGPISTKQTLSQASSIVLYNIPPNSSMLTGTYRVVYRIRALNNTPLGLTNVVVVYTIAES
jgi:hypothetical protein